MVIIKDFSNWFDKKLNTVKKNLANDIGTVSHKQMKYNRLITEYGIYFIILFLVIQCYRLIFVAASHTKFQKI